MLNCFSSDFYYYSKHTQKLSRTEFLEQVLNFIFKWTLDSRNRNMNFTDLEKYIEIGKMIEIVILKPGHDVIIVRVKEEHMKNK